MLSLFYLSCVIIIFTNFTGVTGTETISGSGNWRLTFQRSERGITILQAVTCDKKAALPDELFGLPVIALARKALAPAASEVRGEKLEITCGRADSEWDNRNIEELTLPRPLVRVGDYAMMNCRSLHTLTLYDNIDALHSSAFMNCRAFKKLNLICEKDAYGPVLSGIVPWLSTELDVSVTTAAGETMRLIFPEFFEAYTESEPTHFFTYTIEGSVAYAYHNIFKSRVLSMQEYDGLWEVYITTDYVQSSALRLAWWRLRHPYGLSESMQEAYSDHVYKNILPAFDLVLKAKDTEGLRLLLKSPALTAQELEHAQSAAREAHLTEAMAILLEEQRRRFSGGRSRSFEL